MAPLPPVKTVACETEVDVAIGTDYGYRVSSTNSLGLKTDALYIVVDASKPPVRRCKYLPQNGPAPTGRCTGSGLRKVEGRLQSTTAISPKAGGFKDTEDVTVNVDAEAKREIKKSFGVDLPLGVNVVTNLRSKDLHWRKYRMNDVYRCVDSRWVFAYVEIGEQTGEGIVSVPSWYSYFRGFPPNGEPKEGTGVRRYVER